MSEYRRMQIDAHISPCTKLKSKWINDHNINPNALDLLEKKLSNSLEHIGTGNKFLNITLIALVLRSTTHKWLFLIKV